MQTCMHAFRVPCVGRACAVIAPVGTSATRPLSYSGRLGLSVARSTCLAAAGSEMTRKLEVGPADHVERLCVRFSCYTPNFRLLRTS
jgi:hypothetical protein